jgi:TRAP-type transport system periplasmic protein
MYLRSLTGLCLSLAVTGLASVLTTPSPAAEPIVMRLGHELAVDDPIHIGCLKAAEVIAEKSNGRLKLEIYPANQLGTGKELIAQVATGTLDFAIDTPGPIADYLPRFSALSAPFVARDVEHMRLMARSPFAQDAMKELAQESNLYLLDAWYFGTREMTSRTKPLTKAADMKGVKFRVPEVPLYLDMLKTLGATPTPMAFAEVYLSLQTGVAEGQENPVSLIYSQKFYEVQKYLNLTAHMILPLFPIMSESRWQSLSEDDRAIVREAFIEGGKIHDKLIIDGETDIIAKLKENGMQVIEPDRDSFQQAMGPLYAKYEPIWGKSTIDALRALKP